MNEFFGKIIEADFMPHGHCYFWKPEILWLNVGGDSLIMLAYYSIPPLLFYFAKKRKDLTHRYVFMLFAAFIFACGTTHLIDIWTVWVPTYRLEEVVKVVTGLLSAGTAIVLWRSLPVLLSLPSHGQLKVANEQLQAEIVKREKAKEELKLVNEELEKRVKERTRQLQLANQELEKQVQEKSIAQRELQLKNVALERSNSDLDNFVYCASHDLKAPIFNIEGLLGVLKEEMPAPEENIKELLSRLDVSLAQINRTIYDLTEVSAVQRDVPGFDTSEETPIEQMLLEVEASISDTIRSTGAVVKYDFSRQQTMPMSRKNLRSILYNLLTNAIKYRVPGQPPEINIASDIAEDSIILRVADNGLGIDMEGNKKKLFGLFKRFHDHVEGSGVGLYIAKRIVDNYNGTITVESTLGEGTTFTIKLPCAK